MSDEKEPDEGGPAFPPPFLREETHGIVTPGGYGLSEGMTLRDYYAGQALSKLAERIASQPVREAIIDECLAYADAMIARRKR